MPWSGVRSVVSAPPRTLALGVRLLGRSPPRATGTQRGGSNPAAGHLHHRRLAQARHQLCVDRVEGLQRGQREGDPFVANCPETQRLLTVMDGGHRHFHHGQRAVDDEILCRQKCPHLLENVAPLLLVARLGDAQACPSTCPRSSPPRCGPALRLHNQRESGPGRVDILKCAPVRLGRSHVPVCLVQNTPSPFAQKIPTTVGACPKKLLVG